MNIDYGKYLDGDEWPSESLEATVNVGTGEYEPALQAVYDLVPQKAVAALHKLIRWAHDQAITVEGEELEEQRVRQSTLGRLLARKALKIEDFELYQEHGVNRNALGNNQVARLLAASMLDVATNIADVLPPREIGQLATDVALDINNRGYIVISED